MEVSGSIWQIVRDSMLIVLLGLLLSQCTILRDQLNFLAYSKVLEVKNLRNLTHLG